MRKMKSLLIAVLSIAFLASNSHAASAAPQNNENHPRISHVMAKHEAKTLRANLRDEGLETTREQVDPGSVRLAGYTTSTSDHKSYELDLVASDGDITGTYRLTDQIDGQIVTTTFAIQVVEATARRVIVDLRDIATGATHRYDSTRPQESIAFAIPIGIAAVSVGTLLYYLAIGVAIIYAGHIALETAKAVPRIMEEWNRRKEWRYYTAIRSGSKLFIGGHLTSLQAQSRGRAGQDVWAVSATYAKNLAKTLNPSGVPVWHAPHGAGYLYHYHPYGHSPNMHSFYGA